MKIDSALRSAYDRQLSLNQLVREEVRALVGDLDPRWHFEDRLKSEESFCQKIEAGRFASPLTVEDFYGCTFVVRSASELLGAEDILRTKFDVIERRPPCARATRARPSDFPFDDIRIYARLTPSYIGPKPINYVRFEIQLKTFLQHAWAIATHDLTYKTDELSWAKLRVSHQVKAMLEHAELAIERFSELSSSFIIDKQHTEYAELNKIMRLLKESWEPSALPKDLRRLSETVKNASHLLGATTDQTFDYVREDTAKGGGAASLNLSPFGSIVQSLLQHHTVDISKIKNVRTRITIPAAIAIPSYLNPVKSRLFIQY